MNHYELLGISPNASQEEVERAYRRAAMRTHPDREGGSTEAFQEVEAAGRVLLDAAARKAYDEAGYKETSATASLPERAESMLLDIMEQAATTKQGFLKAIQDCRKQFKLMLKESDTKIAEVKGQIQELSKIDLGKLTKGNPSALPKKLLDRYKQVLEARLATMESDAAFVKEALRQLDVFEGVEEPRPQMSRFEGEAMRRFGPNTVNFF